MKVSALCPKVLRLVPCAGRLISYFFTDGRRGGPESQAIGGLNC